MIRQEVLEVVERQEGWEEKAEPVLKLLDYFPIGLLLDIWGLGYASAAWTVAMFQISSFAQFNCFHSRLEPKTLDLNILLQSQHFYLDILCQRHHNSSYPSLSWKISLLNLFWPLVFLILPTDTSIHPNSHARSDRSSSCPLFLLHSISPIHYSFRSK